MKQFEVEIMGQPYVLGCPEGGEHRFHAAVAQVDDTMNRIRDAGKVRARDRIAVLAALNLALELVDLAERPEIAPPAPIEPPPTEPDEAALRDTERLQALLARLDEALAPEADEASASADSLVMPTAPDAADAEPGASDPERAAVGDAPASADSPDRATASASAENPIQDSGRNVGALPG